jgi:site-specific recombinase XerC
VPLTDEAFALCVRLAEANPSGPLLRNSQGKPWTRNAVKEWFLRLSGSKRRQKHVAAVYEVIAANPGATAKKIATHLAARGIELTWQQVRAIIASEARGYSFLSFKTSAYVIRHTWATEALERGVDPITVATIMGHKGLKQLYETYQHLNRKGEHLRRAMEQATASAVRS